jgi:hypothetical protein
VGIFVGVKNNKRFNVFIGIEVAAHEMNMESKEMFRNVINQIELLTLTD